MYIAAACDSHPDLAFIEMSAALRPSEIRVGTRTVIIQSRFAEQPITAKR